MIRIDRIDLGDRRFSLSYPEESPLIEASVARVGILEPVLLLDGPAFTVVRGFRRILAAIWLGMTEVPAFVLRDLTEREAVLQAVHGNLVRGFNTVEKSLALGKMSFAGIEGVELFDVMKLLGLSPNEKTLRTLLLLASAEDALKSFVFSRNLSMTNVENFLRFGDTEREGLLSLLAPIRTTEGYLRDILRMTSLMKMKEGRLDLDGLEGAESAEELRGRIKRRIHPMLTSLEGKLEALREEMALPPHMDIKVDPSFEKEYIDIHIRVRDVEEASHALEKLRTTIENGSLGSILELTKG